MNGIELPELRLDKTRIRVLTFEEAEEEDIRFWRAASTIERFQHAERLRRIAYGAAATDRLQRILRIIKREER